MWNNIDESVEVLNEFDVDVQISIELHYDLEGIDVAVEDECRISENDEIRIQ